MAREPRRLARGSSAVVAGYTGPGGEPIFNMTTGRLHMQDGATPGGKAHALLQDVEGLADDVPVLVAAAMGSGEAAIASAATTSIGATASRNVLVTGTATITSFGTGSNLYRRVRFAGVLTLTHHATALVLPGGQNIVTRAGDVAVFLADVSGNWRCEAYERADGRPILGGKPQIAVFTLYRSTQTALQGPAAAAWNYPGITGATASYHQWRADIARGGKLTYAYWRLVWSPKAGAQAGSTSVRLVHAETGPANLTQIASFTSPLSGAVLNDAADVSSVLQGFLDAGTYKQIGHQTFGDTTEGPKIYLSQIEVCWE